MDIIVSEEFSSPAVDRLRTRFEVLHDGTLWKEPARLLDAVRGARALLVRNQTQVTAEVLAAAPNLVIVGRAGVGLDNIDVAAASKLGIVVVAPLSANATSVAELTFGLMLGLARKIPAAARSTSEGGWDRKGHTGVELEGKTLCVCGLGRIGGMVAALARAFGMRVVAFDPFIPPDAAVLRTTNATLCEKLENALAAADFVTVHLPLSSQTRHLFARGTFRAMKRGAFFVNTSRGGIVDETALVEALNSGQLAGAGLDVRETEPPGRPAALEKLANVILTPHIGAFTLEAQRRTLEAVSDDLDRALSGAPTLNFVNFDRPKRASGTQASGE